MKLVKYARKHRKKVLSGVLAMLIAGFAILSYVVITLPPSYIDLHISAEIQEEQNPLLDSFMRFISWFGVVPVSIALAVLTAAVFAIFRYRREAVFVVLTLISGAISTGLKILINRPRPTEDLVTIIEKAQYQSFPSGHTMFYTIYFGFLLIIMGNLKKLPLTLRLSVAIISTAMIFMGAVSRVYLGAHWFTDVLGGFILGIIYLFLHSSLYLFFKRQAQDRKV